jgi:isocitrate/isopropylmalate dehydrogenase
MAKEKDIRKKAVEMLVKENWVCWYPAKAKFKQNDVFGIIDLLAARKKSLKKIQLTTLANISTRRKKITCFLKENEIQMTVEIWGWCQRKKKFKKEKIKG